jgi:glyoxylase-like metal-dependent hydrolase (beta-lactamase superfamily II)
VECVLLTHMHGDHIGGMLREGAKAFPNATVGLAQREFDHWSGIGNEAAMKIFAAYEGSLRMLAPVEADVLAAPASVNAPPAADGAVDGAVSADGAVAVDDIAPVAAGGTVDRTVSADGAVSADGIADGAVSTTEDGITPVAAYGHTPGHTMFLVRDGGEQLLIWGDLTHAMAVQMPHPEISVRYDVDPVSARESRLRVLSRVASAGIPAVGMHIPATKAGRVTANGEGYGFREYSPE